MGIKRSKVKEKGGGFFVVVEVLVECSEDKVGTLVKLWRLVLHLAEKSVDLLSDVWVCGQGVEVGLEYLQCGYGVYFVVIVPRHHFQRNDIVHKLELLGVRLVLYFGYQVAPPVVYDSGSTVVLWKE